MEKLQALTVGECIAIARAEFEKRIAEQKLKEFGKDKIKQYYHTMDLYFETKNKQNGHNPI